jgi:hypothetical protein
MIERTVLSIEPDRAEDQDLILALLRIGHMMEFGLVGVPAARAYFSLCWEPYREVTPTAYETLRNAIIKLREVDCEADLAASIERAIMSMDRVRPRAATA